MLEGKKIKIPSLLDLKPREVIEPKDMYVPECGVHYNVPFKEYLKWDCFSKSATSEIVKSAAHYYEYRRTPKDTPAIREGRLLDCMLLEPETFDDEFVVPPDMYPFTPKPTAKVPYPKPVMKPWSAYTDYCKKWKKQQEEAGRIVIKEEQVQKAIECMQVIASKKKITALLSGTKQVSIVWDDPMTGVRCKGRFDVLNEHSEERSIVDLKKTKAAWFSDEGDGGFKKEIGTYGYDIQAAMYSDGWEVLTGETLPFYFVAVEYFPPFECASYSPRDATLLSGRYKYRKALLAYREILESGRYDGYPDEIIDTDIPMYMMVKVDDIPAEEMHLTKLSPNE